MKYTDRVIFGVTALVGLIFSSGAFAQCSVANWSENHLTPSSDAGSPAAVSRYSESCGFKVVNASWVESHHSSDEVYIARFYVLPSGSGGTVDLFVAWDNDDVSVGAELFKVSYDGTNYIFDVSGAAGTSASATATAPSGWSLIEVKYDATAGGTADFQFWVNETWDFAGEAYTTGPTGQFDQDLTGVVEAVQLGAPGGVDTYNAFTFDAFEAHRTTNVGDLLACDADASGALNILDILAQVNESFGNPSVLGQGQPDCDKSGSVNILDILAAVNIVFPSP